MGKVLCRRSIECFLPSSAAHLEESSPEEYDDDDKDNDGVANIMMRGYGKIKASVSSLVSTVVLLHDFHQQVNIGVRDGSKHSQDTIDDSHANEYGSEEAMNDPHDLTHPKSKPCASKDHNDAKSLGDPMPSNSPEHFLIEDTHREYDDESSGHCHGMQRATVFVIVVFMAHHGGISVG
ncbi:MAG: hypothetical protein LQ352_001641 [Teloschistes flavicans]|nr:MAG: hypothetical protein LQ352_001641 [Teloschistes flavicans]